MARPPKSNISKLSQESLADPDAALESTLLEALTAPPTPDPLPALVQEFLDDLREANKSKHTVRAYKSDLEQFRDYYQGPLTGITPAVLRGFSAKFRDLSPTSRARKQATLASFLTWARKHDYMDKDPMSKLDRVKKPERLPRGKSRGEVERVLRVIPKDQKRDRVLFTLLFETGLRISEGLGIHVEDLDLVSDNERLTVTGKGDRERTLLLDDPKLLKLLRDYLKGTGYQHGLLFRAQKNGDGDALRYQSVQERWAKYCQAAGVACTLHQLRHSHATEMVNGGVSLGTVRKRLGHRSLQTTLLYAETSDQTADRELRDWRRKTK